MGKKQTFPLFGDGFAVVPPPVGKPKGRGSNTAGRVANRNFEIGLQTVLELKNCGQARRCHTYGGRRIETPRGGSLPPTHLCPRHCDRIGLRDWPTRAPSWNCAALASSSKSVPAFFLPRGPISRTNDPRTLQNRAPGAPKSSPEPSKTPFLKDI